MADLKLLLQRLLSVLESGDAESRPVMDQAVHPGGSSGARLVDPPALSPAVRVLPSPRPPSVVFPFQLDFLEFQGKDGAMHLWDAGSSAPVASLIKSFSYARLLSLEAVVFTNSASLTYPQTFDALWTTVQQNLSGDEIVKTFGSQRVTFGGPVSSSLPIVLPADLTSINPVLKDSIAYNDTPRLQIRTYGDSTLLATKSSAGTLIIRGTIGCSGVRPLPTK